VASRASRLVGWSLVSLDLFSGSFAVTIPAGYSGLAPGAKLEQFRSGENLVQM